MKKLIWELRRRKVFRSTGIYIGVALAMIEAANNIFPTFDAPDWLYNAVTYLAIGGFPIAIAVAWHFDFTSHGVLTAEEASQQHETTIVIATSRKKDFAVIGFLVLALGFSLYMNFTRKGPSEAEAIPDPVSVLIANFDNSTGEGIFSGTLEQSLALGLEGAPFITSFPRDTAVGLAEKLKPGSGLDGTAAQLVAVREGIKLVLLGYIKADGASYLLGVSAVNSETNEEVANSQVKAKDRAGVLSAIGELATEVRKELGDVSADGIDDARETFTAGNLEAASLYLEAKKLGNAGDDDKAIEKYKLAVAADPALGRAYAGWGTSAARQGKQDEAQQAWEQALGLLDSMSEREKYRTLGTYYLSVTGNYSKAIENFDHMLESYPADDAGYANLALAYFLNLQFGQAMESQKRALDIYPKISLYRANFALFAMYAGDFLKATDIAAALTKDDPGFFYAYIPLAISSAMLGDMDKARANYTSLGEANAMGASFAALGLADIQLYQGQPGQATQMLNSAIETDVASGYGLFAVTKLITRARAELLAGNAKAVRASLEKALELRPNSAQRAMIALEYVELGDFTTASDVSQPLQHMLQAQARAWWGIVQGEKLLAQDNVVGAVDELVKAIGLADLWRGRLALGKAYLKAGYHAEALAEFDACLKRRGEATAILLDDQPSINHIPEMYYWMAQAQWGLGMKEAATTSMETFLAHREGLTDALSEDGRKRLAMP